MCNLTDYLEPILVETLVIEEDNTKLSFHLCTYSYRSYDFKNKNIYFLETWFVHTATHKPM